MKQEADRLARGQFDTARRHALVAGLFDLLSNHSNRMLSFEEVRSRLNVRGQREIGMQTVPIAAIIGSEGRYADFDRRFLPLNRALKSRWSGIGSARLQEIPLPPVELYKLDDVYFVRDGNHRVSVARQQGQEYIDAHVVELTVDVPLGPDLSFHNLLLKEEYSDFLEWTGLSDLRPTQLIEFSEPGGYLELIHHINTHRYYLGVELQRDISLPEAVISWYDRVYTPIVSAIRQQQTLAQFPGRTEADLYRWVMDYRWFLHERTGTDPGPDEAVSEYTALFGQRGPISAISDWLRHLFGG